MFVTSWERLGVGLPIGDKAMSLAVRWIVHGRNYVDLIRLRTAWRNTSGQDRKQNYGLDPLYVIVIDSAHCSRPRDPLGNLIESEESSA